MRRIFVVALVVMAALTFAPQAGAQNARSCANVSSSDMSDAGVVAEAVDTVIAFNCTGAGEEREIPGATLMNKKLMNMGPGQYFVPEMGIWVEDIDVTASKGREVKTDCTDVAAYGSQNSSSSMGHGGCN
ncbi:MAG: hypothetical protein KTR21_13475 [Rhodobacteraceae bacterium]|nr:hypothetical protein [Paracoccaceae bacterium]